VEQTKTVVIVARTHMHHGRVCVGALAEDGENLRLLNSAYHPELDEKSPYRVGEKWRICYEPRGEQKPPHLEDVAVAQAVKVGSVDDMAGYVLPRAKPWAGGIDELFERKIHFTVNGAGFISKNSIPSCSTGFWIPYCDLRLQEDGQGKLAYYALGDYRHLAYMGVQEPIEFVEAKCLVRVSLARWWKPEEAPDPIEERCYAQVSGVLSAARSDCRSA